MFNISRLHYITQDISGYSHEELADKACIAGADWVQLRLKNKSFSEYLKTALEVQKICKKYRAKLIINDNVKVAKEIRADGVHLGKTDMNPVEARRILGPNFIIGGTANIFDDVVALNFAKVNYIGIGPYRFTNTKENLSPILGLHGYSEIVKQADAAGFSIPMIAIGGITVEDVDAIIKTGLFGIAVSSAVNKSTNKKDTIDSFKKSLSVSLKSTVNIN